MSDEHDLVALTDDEERRFAELFTPHDRMTLTAGWKDALREAVVDARASGHGDMFQPPPPSGVAHKTHSGGATAVRVAGWVGFAAIVALPLLLMVILGLWVVFDDGMLEEPSEVLDPAVEIALPGLQRVELPEGTIDLINTDDYIMAITADSVDTDTTIYRSTDGRTWDEFAELALIDPSVSIVNGSLVVAGGSTESMRSHPGIPGVQTPRDVRVMQTLDDGATWSQSDITLSSTDNAAVTVLEEIFVAQTDDSVVLGFDTIEVVDATPAARQQGLVGPDDHVVWITSSDFTPVPYAIGPEVFGEVELELDQWGWFNHDSELYASTDGGEFVSTDTIDGYQFDLDFTEFNSEEFWLEGTASNGEFGLFVVHEGRLINAEQESSFDGALRKDGWVVPQDLFTDRRFEMQQSVDGGLSFESILGPDQDMGGYGIETDFGMAITWQPDGMHFAVNEVAEVDGYVVTSGIHTVTVVDPQGNVLVENQGHHASPKNPTVVTDQYGTTQIFDESGERVALIRPDDFDNDLIDQDRSAFLSWSTDGTDWRFAALPDLSPGDWFLANTANGLFIADRNDLATAAIVDWPAFTQGN